MSLIGTVPAYYHQAVKVAATHSLNEIVFNGHQLFPHPDPCSILGHIQIPFSGIAVFLLEVHHFPVFFLGGGSSPPVCRDIFQLSDAPFRNSIVKALRDSLSPQVFLLLRQYHDI